MRTPLFLSCCFFLLLAIAGCTSRSVSTGPGGSGAPGDAEAAWRTFAARSHATETVTGPFRISANLRYTSPQGENIRVSSYLWGNGYMQAPSPLRLDLIAGVGSVVGKVREGEGEFLAYNPEENAAYRHTAGTGTLPAFGVPIPLTLYDLSLLLTGRGGRLLLPEGAASGAVAPLAGRSDEGYLFRVENAPLPGTLEISPEGVPLSWLNADGWRMVFEPEADNPLQPRRVRITHPRGYEALIVVRSVERPSMPFGRAQLELSLPPGAAYRALGTL